MVAERIVFRPVDSGTTEFDGDIVLQDGASIVGSLGSAISGFTSIEGIDPADIPDLSTAEIVTAGWTFSGNPLTADDLEAGGILSVVDGSYINFSGEWRINNVVVTSSAS